MGEIALGVSVEATINTHHTIETDASPSEKPHSLPYYITTICFSAISFVSGLIPKW